MCEHLLKHINRKKKKIRLHSRYSD